MERNLFLNKYKKRDVIGALPVTIHYQYNLSISNLQKCTVLNKNCTVCYFTTDFQT